MQSKRAHHAGMFSLLDTRIAATFFRKKRAELRAQGIRIRNAAVEIIVIKDNRDPATRSFVAFYDVRSGSRAARLVGVGRPLRKSKFEYGLLRALARARRSDLGVPRAYLLDKKRRVFFMEYAQGVPLARLIKQRGTMPRSAAEAIARGIRALGAARLVNGPADIPRTPYFKWVERDLILARKKMSRRQRLLLNRTWSEWKKVWRAYYAKEPLSLAHGDMNPRNIYLQKTGTRTRSMFIDFDRAHLAPALWDFAGFLSQLETYPDWNISSAQRFALKARMMRAWSSRVAALTPRDLTRIKDFEQYFRLAAIVNILAWGNPYTTKRHIRFLIGNL